MSEFEIEKKELELLKNNIKGRLPKYIISNNSNKTLKIIKFIEDEIDSMKDMNFIFFEKTMNNLINLVDEQIKQPFSIYELIPTYHELLDIKNNYKILLDNLKNNELSFKNNNQSQLNNGWKTKAEVELNKMFVEFNLKSVQIAKDTSWKDVYKWAKITYNAIAEAQFNIGLNNYHVGVNQCLNLVFNPESLKQSKGNGKMFADEHVNSIVLTSFGKEIQKIIWQHEYAHVLDNRVGIKIAKEQLNSNKIHHCIFLSQMEMERHLNENYNDYKLSNDEINYESQVWMTEAISHAVSGKSSDSFKEYNKKCSEEFSKTLIQSLIINVLKEDYWINLNINKKEQLLNDINLMNYVDSIAEDVYINGVRNFYKNHLKNKDNLIKNIQNLNNIKYILNDNCVQENIDVNFKNNLENMSWDFLKIMKKYFYSHTNNTKYFPSSKTVTAAAEHSLKYISPYHTRTLEIFARSCEDLQRPLEVSTTEYFLEKEKHTINTENYLNPTLNKNERKVFINTIHSLVRALGMNVNNIVDYVPSLQEKVINIPQTTYSTVSDNEYVANLVLEKAKQKTFKNNF